MYSQAPLWHATLVLNILNSELISYLHQMTTFPRSDSTEEQFGIENKGPVHRNFSEPWIVQILSSYTPVSLIDHHYPTTVVLGDTDRMHKHYLRLTEDAKMCKTNNLCIHETFPVVEDIRQTQITPVQRGTHLMLCLGQEERAGISGRKTSWRKWLLSRSLKKGQDVKREKICGKAP